LHYVRVEKIKADIYERWYELSIKGDDESSIWAYSVDIEEYAGENIETVSGMVGKELYADFSVEWINNYQIVGVLDVLGIEQTIQASSHVVVKGIVKKVIDEYTILCNVGKLGVIRGDFEEKIKEIQIDSCIIFTGNLRVEFQK